MEGHLFSVFGKSEKKFKISKIKFSNAGTFGFRRTHRISPCKKNNWIIKSLDKTLDDAVGEAFDKVARMLGCPTPATGDFKNCGTRKDESDSPLEGWLACETGWKNSSTSP